jgi:hypothetical protein
LTCVSNTSPTISCLNLITTAKISLDNIHIYNCSGTAIKASVQILMSLRFNGLIIQE